MMYLYAKLPDHTIVTHSHLIAAENVQKIEVHFERPSENGFDSARCVLPEMVWKFNEGYSENEIELFSAFVQANTDILFTLTKNTGISLNNTEEPVVLGEGIVPPSKEDHEYLEHFLAVCKRYNINPNKATRLEYDFVVNVSESEWHALRR